MKNNELLEKVSSLGFPLFRKEDNTGFNATLAEVVESRDLGLWEGFPLLLANAMNKGVFDHEEVKKALKKKNSLVCLSRLLLVSLVLYEVSGLSLSGARALKSALSDKSKDYDEMLKQFKQGKELPVNGKKLSPERLKNTFRVYFKEEEHKLSELVSMKEEFGVEYALSQVFSPKQKELFFKKLKGEKLTKTEKEYYSRTVKKKVAALANSELHRLAQKVA